MSDKFGNKKRKSVDIFEDYAEYYNIIYQDKNYTKEAKFISNLINTYSISKINSRVLDLACGTGRHLIELAKFGYKVEGSDLSKSMIEVAKKMFKEKGMKISLYTESFQDAHKISKKYDVVISMFSAINYLMTYNELSKTLKNIRTLLNKKGIFIFDFWNGYAVINNFSAERIKRMSLGGKEILRISKTTINQVLQTATVNFHFMLFDNNQIIKEFEEVHALRYFFLQEMSDILKANGFKIIMRCPFMKISQEITTTDWNITYVACKAE